MGKPVKSHAHWLPITQSLNHAVPQDSVQISTNGKMFSILSYYQTDDEGGIFANSNKDNTMAMTKVYEWDDENYDWKPRHTFQLPGAVNMNDVSHSLSWDGSVVAMTESSRTVNRMVIYRWNTDESQYIEQYEEKKAIPRSSLLGDSFRSVSLAGDGSTLFVGTSLGGGNVLTYRDDYATACRDNTTHPQLLHIAIFRGDPMVGDKTCHQYNHSTEWATSLPGQHSSNFCTPDCSGDFKLCKFFLPGVLGCHGVLYHGFDSQNLTRGSTHLAVGRPVLGHF